MASVRSVKLRLSPRAVRDIEDISDYVAARNPTAAHRVRNLLQASLEIVALHPEIGRAQTHGVRRHVVPQLPYLVFYRIDEAARTVNIVTIRHAARTSKSAPR